MYNIDDNCRLETLAKQNLSALSKAPTKCVLYYMVSRVRFGEIRSVDELLRLVLFGQKPLP